MSLPNCRFDAFDDDASSVQSNLGISEQDEDDELILKPCIVIPHRRTTMMRKSAFSSSSRSSCPERSLSRVGFGAVRIHSHSCVLGSNPTMSNGLPVELDWDYILSETFELDDYEKGTYGQEKKALRLTKEEREAILRMRGHSRSSFNRVFAEISQIKASREEAKKTAEGGKHVVDKEQQMDDYFVMANVSLRDFKRESRRQKKEEEQQQQQNVPSTPPQQRRSLSPVPKRLSRSPTSSPKNSSPINLSPSRSNGREKVSPLLRDSFASPEPQHSPKSPKSPKSALSALAKSARKLSPLRAPSLFWSGKNDSSLDSDTRLNKSESLLEL